MTALGLRAQKGGAVIVALGRDGAVPRLLLSTFLAIDIEPYRAAAALPRDEAAAVVAEGRKRQDRLMADGLRSILAPLGRPVAAGLLVNRAGWITDLVGYSREWAEHIPVAENLGLRDALRFACRENAIAAAELDETSLAERLGEADQWLKPLGLAAGRPWRREQKLACLAAWTAAGR